ncbi:MAG: ATP-binding cassette domain-containing protein [Synechococcaceae bacterium WB9_2_112]|nr:ATP-binding cassette domain-containing protein [Synechococcaceae bacterium WB9_2_112]
MTSTQHRQHALLRGMAALLLQRPQPAGSDVGHTDQACRVLEYAMARLADPRRITPGGGSIAELLERNAISYRDVRTPNDLGNGTRSLLIVISQADGRLLAVHRQGGRTLIFDGHSDRPRPLDPQAQFQPIAYELYAALPWPLRSWTQLLGFALGRDLTPLLTLLVSALVVALFTLSIPLLTTVVVGTVLPRGAHQLLAETALMVLLIIVCSVIAQGFCSLANLRLESLLNLRLEAALWSHLMRLPLHTFESVGTADLIARVGAISQMRQLLSQGLLATGLGLLFSLTNLVLMLMLQAQLALVAAAFSAVSAVVMGVLVGRSSRLEAPLLQSRSRAGELALQAVTGLPQIRVSGSEPFVFARWACAVQALASLQRRSESLNQGLETLARVLTPLGQVVVFSAMLNLLHRSAATQALVGSSQLVATVVAFEAAYLAFNSQLAAVVIQAAASVARLKALWQGCRELIVAAPEASRQRGARCLELKGHFSVQNLQVRLPGAAEPLLVNLNLTIAAGSYTAITGPSGCGKTTLLRCLLGLLEPDAGVISIDGIDLRELALAPYRRQLGVVLQNAPLPSGSIAEVVRAGRSYSRDAIWTALDQAAIASDVERMPMQLETLIGEGGHGISGGQRQRLALARALLGQPRVLLLDEATSALDAPTQEAVSQTLARLPMTRIAIAHRIATLQSADQIVVIEHGTISERGNFSRLMQQAGGYLQRNPAAQAPQARGKDSAAER